LCESYTNDTPTGSTTNDTPSPDVRSPQFAQQAHNQPLAVAESDFESDDQAFIDALGDDG